MSFNKDKTILDLYPIHILYQIKKCSDVILSEILDEVKLKNIHGINNLLNYEIFLFNPYMLNQLQEKGFLCEYSISGLTGLFSISLYWNKKII